MKNKKWLMCPMCNGKTRTMIYEETTLRYLKSVRKGKMFTITFHFTKVGSYGTGTVLLFDFVRCLEYNV